MTAAPPREMQTQSTEHWLPAVLCALLGTSVSAVFQLLNLFDWPDVTLVQKFTVLSLPGETLSSSSEISVLIYAFAIALAIALIIVHIPGIGRRLGILVTTLFLLLGAVTLAALFQIYISPFSLLLTTLWSGVCAIYYASSHPYLSQ